MAGTPQRERTQLKYAVEVQIPQSTPMLGLLEPLLERVVYEDLPSNMLALKARVEQLYTSEPMIMLLCLSAVLRFVCVLIRVQL